MVRCKVGATLPELRASGLAAATGDVVLLTDDSCVARGNWAPLLMASFVPDVDVAGGPIVGGMDGGMVDAAASLAEFGFYGPLQEESAAPALACANVGYHRRVLADVIRWSSACQWDAEVHQRLAAAGARFRLVRAANVEPQAGRGVREFCRDRYAHGREYGEMRGAKEARLVRLLRVVTSPLLPPLLAFRVWRTAGRARPWGFARALPLVLLFFGAWSVGEAVGYLRAKGET